MRTTITINGKDVTRKFEAAGDLTPFVQAVKTASPAARVWTELSGKISPKLLELVTNTKNREILIEVRQDATDKSAGFVAMPTFGQIVAKLLLAQKVNDLIKASGGWLYEIEVIGGSGKQTSSGEDVNYDDIV